MNQIKAYFKTEYYYISLGLSLWFYLVFWYNQIGFKNTFLFVMPQPFALLTIISCSILLWLFSPLIFKPFEYLDLIFNRNLNKANRMKIYSILAMAIIFYSSAGYFARYIRTNYSVTQPGKIGKFILLGYLSNRVITQDQDSILILKEYRIIRRQ